MPPLSTIKRKDKKKNHFKIKILHDERQRRKNVYSVFEERHVNWEE
jgi:hypothetical protein